MSQATGNDAVRLRERTALVKDDLSHRSAVPSFGSPSLVARTTAFQAYPTTARCFFGCAPQTVLGSESEGGAGTFTAGPSTFLALNVGTAIPPAGTLVLATFVESRWVFRFDG